MCTTCGCSDNGHFKVTHLNDESPGWIQDPRNGNGHERDRALVHAHYHGTTVSIEQEILIKNNELAERNRIWFEERNILAINLVSSPGSGKTTLLERTIRELGEEVPVYVIEGDQETVNDARKIRETGCRVVQINTGAGCHLDAEMLSRGLETLHPSNDSVVLIENVGNLVCPALFDLGEFRKVVILSVTEGEDKPIKYPHMFRASGAMILNKIDLLPHLSFDVNRCVGYAHEVNPETEIFPLSATTGEGVDEWVRWLKSRIHMPRFEIAG